MAAPRRSDEKSLLFLPHILTNPLSPENGACLYFPLLPAPLLPPLYLVVPVLLSIPLIPYLLPPPLLVLILLTKAPTLRPTLSASPSPPRPLHRVTYHTKSSAPSSNLFSSSSVQWPQPSPSPESSTHHQSSQQNEDTTQT